MSTKKRPLRRTLVPHQHAFATSGVKMPDGRIVSNGGGMLPMFPRPGRIVCWISKRIHKGSATDALDSIHRAQFYWAARGVTLARLDGMDERAGDRIAFAFVVQGEREAIEHFSTHEKDLVRIEEREIAPESDGMRSYVQEAHRPPPARPAARSKRTAGTYSTDNSGKPFLRS